MLKVTQYMADFGKQRSGVGQWLSNGHVDRSHLESSLEHSMLGWGLRICVSDKLAGDPGTAAKDHSLGTAALGW